MHFSRPTPADRLVRRRLWRRGGPSNEDGEGEDDHDDDDENEHQAEELIRSGDTIAYGIDMHGNVIASLRPIEIEDLPNDDAIDQALLGSIVVEAMDRA